MLTTGSQLSTLSTAYGGFFRREEDAEPVERAGGTTNDANDLLPRTAKEPLGGHISRPQAVVVLTPLEFGVLCALAGVGVAALLVHLSRRDVE